MPAPRTATWAAVAAASAAVLAAAAALRRRRRRRRHALPPANPHSGYSGLVGGTPTVELKALSALCGCRLFVKCEHLNPGGTGKDRMALAMVRDDCAVAAVAAAAIRDV
jgi:cysteine synthase A